MIEIIEGRYFLGLWHVRGDLANWLGAVYRDGKGLWRLTHRVRENDAPSDTSVCWTVNELQKPADEAEVLQHMTILLRAIGVMMQAEPDFLPLRSDDVDTLLDKIRSVPWLETSSNLTVLS